MYYLAHTPLPSRYDDSRWEVGFGKVGRGILVIYHDAHRLDQLVVFVVTSLSQTASTC